MTAFIDDSDRFWRMADAICMGTASDEDLQELEARVLTDDKARSLYIAYCQLDSALELELGGQHAGMLARDKIRNEMLTAVADDFPSTIPASCPMVHATPALGFLSTAYHGTIGYFSHEIPFSFLMGALFTGLLVLVAWLVPVSSLVQTAKNSSPMPSDNQRQFTSTPKMEFIGRITGIVDVQWSDINTSTEQGNGVPLGRKYALASGLMEITYATGAKVILQGPVTYEAESRNGGFLPIGKLTGKVENDMAKGFKIRTPAAAITDLGTEFGIEVDKQGNTTSYVFRGSVEVQVVAADGKKEGNAKVLHENQSAHVEKDNGKRGGGNRLTVFVTPTKPTSFIREIPKQTIKNLDLVDVVAGGDGFSGRRDRGINPTNGKVTPTAHLAKSIDELMVGDNKYHRVDALPFVDGVFIPDGRLGPVQIDSSGHNAWFPNTVNRTAEYIWAGGEIPARFKNLIPSVLDGIDYASSGHGLLFLHANSGITFDLKAIRRVIPGQNLVRFHAVVGNTETDTAKGEWRVANIEVLIDGESRFRRSGINRKHGTYVIRIPIKAGDRFLTLTATDGGDGIFYDWIVFGDPQLDLLPINVGDLNEAAK